MLFATLSAGNMTVQASEASAVAKIGSSEYTSLADAITAANDETNAVEIDLCAAVVLTDVTIDSNVTLDLNGCTLTTSSSITVAPGGNVVDNSDKKSGRLILGENAKVSWTSNSQVPVYDANTNTGGYAFATMTEQVYRKSAMGADTFELIFKPDFGVLNDLMANNYTTTNVDNGINLKWTDADGNSKSAVAVYDKTKENLVEMVKTVYTAIREYSFYIKATGANSFDNLTITPMAKSELGMV